jgi:hypothetical protein
MLVYTIKENRFFIKKSITFLCILMLFSFSKKSTSEIQIKKTSLSKKQITTLIKEEYPQLVWESQVPLKNKHKSPALFYTPHQDDETLGMGASIAEAVRKGHPVFVVLMTNGKNEGIKNLLNGNQVCEYHHEKHSFNLTDNEVIAARNAEFIAACKTLGVHKIFIANNGLGYDETIGLDSMSTNFFKTIEYFHLLYPNASHHTINGNCDPYNTKGDKMNAHRACANALNLIYSKNYTKNILLYKDYVYYFPKEERTATFIKKVHRKDLKKRQKACDEYNLYNPALGRYAIGYQHSVWQLFNESYSSEFEYIDLISTECK